MEEFIKKIVVQAGELVMKKYEKSRVEYSKEDVLDVVTDADLESNNFLIESIKKKFPDHGIVSEEMKDHQIFI